MAVEREEELEGKEIYNQPLLIQYSYWDGDGAIGMVMVLLGW